MASNILSLTDASTSAQINISENKVFLVEELPSLQSRVNHLNLGVLSVYTVTEDLTTIKNQSTTLYNATINTTNVLLNSQITNLITGNASGGTTVTGAVGGAVNAKEDLPTLNANIGSQGGPQFSGVVLGTNPTLEAWVPVGGTLGYNNLSYSYSGVFTPDQTAPDPGIASGDYYNAEQALNRSCENPVPANTIVWAFDDSNGLAAQNNVSNMPSFFLNCATAPPSLSGPARVNHLAIIDNTVRTQYDFIYDFGFPDSFLIVDKNLNPIGGRTDWGIGPDQYAVLYWNASTNAWDVETNNTGGLPSRLPVNPWWRALYGITPFPTLL